MPKWLPIDESYGGFHLDRHSNSTGRCTYSEYSRGRENSRYADFHSFRYGGCRKKIYAMGCKAIVVKGGHHIGNAVDVLFNGENFYHLKHPALIRKYSWDRLYLFFCNRFPACKGKSVPLAVESAKAYVTMAIEHSLAIGKGCGPTHHFYELYQHGLSKE